MAWPVTARYQSFVASTTRISAAFLNALQDAITPLYAGGKTVKRLVADGTGDQVPFTEAGSNTNYLGMSWNGTGIVPAIDLHDETVGAAQARIYRSNAGFCAVAVNAYNRTSDSKWVQEDATKDSFAWALDPSSSSPVMSFKKAAGSAAWLTWDNGPVHAGNLIAQGTPSGSSGPGLVKTVRAYTTGTAFVTGNFTLSAGWGATAAVNSVRGTDMAGVVTFTAAGAGLAPDPTVSFNWKDGTFTNAPVVTCWLEVVPSDGDLKPLTWVPTATGITIKYRTSGVNAGAGAYSIGWHAVGI